MSRRAKILIALGFVMIAGILLFLWWRSRSTATISESAQTQNGSASSLRDFFATEPAPLSSTKVLGNAGGRSESPRAGMEAFSRSFTERYGSYSNQSNFENIENLYPFMTEKMQVAAQAFVAQERAKQKGTESYAGVTTRVLSTDILFQQSSGAKLAIKTQRAESGVALRTPRVYYQDIELNLVSGGGIWKVDEAIWK